MAERTMDWTGAERRSGDDRRVAVMAYDEERRHEERRRGGVGTQKPNPLEALLEGIDTGSADQVQADQAAAATADGRPALGQLPESGTLGSGTGGAPLDRPVDEDSPAGGGGRRLRPAHEPHDAIPSIAAIQGHPLHPALVPLPIGAFVGALAADVAFAATGDRFFARSSRLLTGTALVTGVAAGALGAIDFLGRERVRSHTAAWVHAGGNLAALGIGAASLAIRAAKKQEPGQGVLPAGLALSVAAGGVLFLTGWLGGELSYRHRIGVMEEEGSA